MPVEGLPAQRPLCHSLQQSAPPTLATPPSPTQSTTSNQRVQVYGNIVYEMPAYSGGMYVAGLAVDPLAKVLLSVTLLR